MKVVGSLAALLFALVMLLPSVQSAEVVPGQADTVVNIHWDMETLQCVDALAPIMETCWSCKKDKSKDACKYDGSSKYLQCHGERSDCSKKGCAIQGSHSCKSSQAQDC